MGLDGAMVQMVSHGLVSGALFFCIGVLYDRMHSRQIADYGGVINTMPAFGAFMVLFAMANAGLPGTSGFVGEFLVILASFRANFWYAFLAAMTLILGAAYTLKHNAHVRVDVLYERLRPRTRAWIDLIGTQPMGGTAGYAGSGVASPVPEPATMALLGLGSLVALRRRRA